MNLIERLAEKKRGDPFLHHYTTQDEARWWLDAIADALDTNGEDHRTHAGPHVHSTSSDWLRSQANAGTQATIPKSDSAEGK